LVYVLTGPASQNSLEQPIEDRQWINRILDFDLRFLD